MPVFLSDDEYSDYLRVKSGSATDDEWETDPRAAFLKDLDKIPDGDKEAWTALTQRYNAAIAEPDAPAKQKRTSDEEFHADLDKIPDGDKQALNEVLARHGRLPETEG